MANALVEAFGLSERICERDLSRIDIKPDIFGDVVSSAEVNRRLAKSGTNLNYMVPRRQPGHFGERHDKLAAGFMALCPRRPITQIDVMRLVLKHLPENPIGFYEVIRLAPSHETPKGRFDKVVFKPWMTRWGMYRHGCISRRN
jgi:hypothetical protein